MGLFALVSIIFKDYFFILPDHIKIQHGGLTLSLIPEKDTDEFLKSCARITTLIDEDNNKFHEVRLDPDLEDYQKKILSLF